MGSPLVGNCIIERTFQVAQSRRSQVAAAAVAVLLVSGGGGEVDAVDGVGGRRGQEKAALGRVPVLLADSEEAPKAAAFAT